MKKDTFPVTLEIAGAEFEGTCGFTYTPGRPAYTSGPPENCYPEEPAETELFDLIIHNEAGREDMSMFLTDEAVRESVEDQLFAYLEESYEPDEDQPRRRFP